MNVFRYPVRSLVGDYLRAGVGLAVGLGVLASAPGSVTIIVIFGGLTALFGGFAYRTLRRHLLRVALTAEAIHGSGLGTQEVPWGKLDLVKLRYFGTQRQRKREAGGGFMQLTLKGAGASLTLESSIEGFEYIAWCAAKAARENGVGLDPASAGNLLELGIDADEDGPPPEIKATRKF
ncbi:MAG: hypothetical protein IID48_14705 [Proteobacteria bacterium]|nr:hypothetical protein [Pseudomonadota bacterium]